MRYLASLLLVLGTACGSHAQRGIADRRTNFEKFLPMQGNPAQYGLKTVRPYFRVARRAEVLHAIESACQGGKEGSSVIKKDTGAGYYVNCNPRNRQLLNGYVPVDPRKRPHS